MPLRLIAVGTRMPDWVEQAYTDYARRLRGSHRLELTEIPLARRSAADSPARVQRLVAEEGRRTLSVLGHGDCVVALDERGREHSSRELAAQLPRWLQVQRCAADWRAGRLRARGPGPRVRTLVPVATDAAARPGARAAGRAAVSRRDSDVGTPLSP